MKLLNTAFAVFLIASLIYFEIIHEQTPHVFINSPFDEQRAYYKEFFLWKDAYEGKFNVAFLRYGFLIRQRPICFVQQGFHARSKKRRANQS